MTKRKNHENKLKKACNKKGSLSTVVGRRKANT